MTATIFSLSRQYPCWDAILRSLDLPTIKALRLAHRELAESCLTPCFLQYVATQTVELIPDDGGKALAELCDHPLSTHVKTLKVITNVYDTSIIEKSIQTGRDWTISPYAGRLRCSRTLSPREIESLHKEVLWLRERHDAERGIADEEIIGRLARTFQRLKSLRALSLDARLCYGPGVYDSADRTASWLLVRQGASRLFDLVIGAVGQSGVPIEEFDAYWSRTGCAVSIDSLARSLPSIGQDGGADPWDAMRSLSLRVCTTEEGQGDTGVTHSSSKRVWGDVFLKLASSVPRLQSLSIHVFDPPARDDLSEMFSALAAQQHMTSLKTCSLKGMLVTSSDLSRFFSHQQHLEQLELSWITLVDGKEWQGLLSRLPQVLPNLRELRLCHLSGGSTYNGLLNLETQWMKLPDKPTGSATFSREIQSVPCDVGYLWRVMTFTAEDLQRGLDFLPAPGCMLDSPQLHILANYRLREFQPASGER